MIKNKLNKWTDIWLMELLLNSLLKEATKWWMLVLNILWLEGETFPESSCTGTLRIQLVALTGVVVQSFWIWNLASRHRVIGASVEGYRTALFPVWPSASCQKQWCEPSVLQAPAAMPPVTSHSWTLGTASQESWANIDPSSLKLFLLGVMSLWQGKSWPLSFLVIYNIVAAN